MRRRLQQVSFADGLVNQRAGRNEWLDRLSEIIDWSAIDKTLSSLYSSDEGRPSYPVLTLVKLLLLQQWYGLSDPGLEEAVDDRLSFRRFAGLPLDCGVPDHSTIWRFRQALAADGLDRELFVEINRQIAARGLIIRQGTLIDASLIKAAVAPPPFDEGTVSERDPDAGWTRKNDTSHFGYKAHIAVDEGSLFIRENLMTGADIHDSLPVRALICGDEAAVYADKAYGSKKLRGELRQAAIKDGLMYKAMKNKPLTSWQKQMNKLISPIRAAVERTFACMKRHYGFDRVRYIGLVRNGCALNMLCTAINLRRLLVVMP